MKKLYLLSGLFILALIAVVSGMGDSSTSPSSSTYSEKVYVAVEGEGTVNVINPILNASIGIIDLTDETTGAKYLPHNVQSSPDGKSVWVTANARAEKHSSLFTPIAYADEGHGEMSMDVGDQVIVINPYDDTIIKRIPLGNGQHLAHVDFTPDGTRAFVAAEETSKLYEFETKNYLLKRTVTLPEGSGPHGMRVSPDGKRVFMALMDGKGLGIFDILNETVSVLPLNGSAVQTAVTPNGKYVVVSVYDTRSVALYDTALESVSYVKLPDSSQGAVQLYPSSDSQFIYIADQGVLQNRPANNKVYKLNLLTKKITERITVGKAPHGIIVNSDDSKVYVTNLQGGTVSVVDTKTGREITQIPVGDQPNGISIWKGERTIKDNDTLMGQEITVYKTKTCGCCHLFIEYLEKQGVNVNPIEVTDLAAIKGQYGVPSEVQSCHTSIVGNYVVEGHVPGEVIERLLSEEPDIKGIALPGMPAGSPGMPGLKTEEWIIYAIENDGTVTEFMSY